MAILKGRYHGDFAAFLLIPVEASPCPERGGVLASLPAINRHERKVSRQQRLDLYVLLLEGLDMTYAK